MKSERRAFTLIELLVVVAIIALLISILLPSLNAVRARAKASVCLSNMHQLSFSLTQYTHSNRDSIIPSYNMVGVVGTEPVDGWACILDRDGFVGETPVQTQGTIFYCPETTDVSGVSSGQTGNDTENPKGWLDWPFLRTGSSNDPVTIPERRFNKIIRVSYWINADNPIGSATIVVPDTFYTGSVGYGPGTNGLSIQITRADRIIRPAELIALADGLYAGRQRDAQFGMTNSRIGYRHSGNEFGMANVAFADGHAAPIGGKQFPRGSGGSNNIEEVRMENRVGRPTVYANPVRSLGLTP